MAGVLALGVALLCTLVARIVSAPPPEIPPPPPPLEWDDIHPLFWAWVGDPEDPVAQWTSRRYLYEGGQPIAPIYIAVGETIHCKDMSEDLDTVIDGQSSVEDDIASWAWSPAGSGSGGDYHKTVQAGDGEFIVECTVDDAARYENDGPQTSMMKFQALAVDYVVIRPNSNPEVIDISQQTGKTFTGYAYNFGDDGLRYYDELGNAIGGRPNDDKELAAVFDWSFSAPELVTLDPVSGATSTTVSHKHLTGQGTLTGTYTGGGASVSGTAAVRIVDGLYSIDLVGINFDEVQNVPINAKAVAALDGTGNTGEINAKVVITGEASTEYMIVVSDNSDKLGINDEDFSITTNAQGDGEHQIVLQAQSGTPSAGLEDIRVSAEMQPAGGGGALAETWEDVTVYRLEVAVGEIQTSKGTTGNGHALDYRVSLFDNDVALTKHAADLTCKRFAWFVANPAGAYTGNARGKLRAKQKFEDFPTRGGIWANSMEGDGDISMELSWGIVTVTWQMTENKGAWSSWKGEVSIKGTDAEWREAPTAQANVHMTGATGGNRQSVTTTSTIDTFPCTYVVGNPNSCAEARVRMSCAGAVDDPGDMRGCEADVQLEVGKEVVVEIAEPPLELVE